jgi:hypothetical protein
MSKRFIDTNLKKEDWYLAMPASYKLFWTELFTECNHAGIYRVNTLQFNRLNRLKVIADKALTFFNAGKERIQVIRKGLWYIKGFVRFQYGNVSKSTNRFFSSIQDIHNQYDINMPPIWGANTNTTLYTNSVFNTVKTEIQEVEDLRKEAEALRKEIEALKKQQPEPLKTEENDSEKKSLDNSKIEKIAPKVFLESNLLPANQGKEEKAFCLNSAGPAYEPEQQPPNPEPLPAPPAKRISQFPTMDQFTLPLNRMTGRLAQEIYKRTKGKFLTREEILNYFELFKLQNLNGKKFYEKPDDVFTHFTNWIKFQKYVPVEQERVSVSYAEAKAGQEKYQAECSRIAKAHMEQAEAERPFREAEQKRQEAEALIEENRKKAERRKFEDERSNFFMNLFKRKEMAAA